MKSDFKGLQSGFGSLYCVLRYSGTVWLALHDLYPVELDQAYDRGDIDIAITRSLEHSKNLQSRVLLRDPLVAVPSRDHEG
jgi:DNA-binding transcriptional LysR family regulator